MTAIVGVLNKHAVAIAADSAVTLGGGKKVLNTASKLFALPSGHNVAIAVYGNAEFLGTPWEVIIKEYCKQLKKKPLPSLRQYVDDFQKFLKRRNYFCTSRDAKFYLKASVQILFMTMARLLNEKNESINRILYKMEKAKGQPLVGGFTEDTVNEFMHLASSEIEEGYKVLVKEGFTKTLDETKELVKALFTRDVSPMGKAGLVFAGYGESDIFPSIYDCAVGCVVDGLLEKVVKRTSKIDKFHPSDICPFAQTDVMKTMLDGVSPRMQSVYMKTLALTFTKLKEEMSGLIQNDNPDLAARIQGLDISPFGAMFFKISKSIQQKEYSDPFVESVAHLEKEDLADFAESLITLTSLKRKISYDQETVGGPVDVMVISKGDGVIWMKKKEYFDSNKNPQYMSKYYHFYD